MLNLLHTFRKDLKTDKILKSGGRLGRLSDVSLGRIIGGGAFGCFDFNNCQVVSLLGAIPGESKLGKPCHISHSLHA